MSTATIHNNTEFGLNTVRAEGRRLGSFVNGWRNRRLTLYEHPTSTTLVISVGEFLDGSETVVVCVEDFSCYSRQLIHNNWTDTQ